MLENQTKLCLTESDFLKKKKKKKKCTKNGENGPKKGFFEFIEKFGH